MAANTHSNHMAYYPTLLTPQSLLPQPTFPLKSGRGVLGRRVEGKELVSLSFRVALKDKVLPPSPLP